MPGLVLPQPGGGLSLRGAAVKLADEVLEVVRAGGGLSVGPMDEEPLGPGLSVPRLSVRLACARWLHGLGPDRTDPNGPVAYAYIVGVLAGQESSLRREVLRRRFPGRQRIIGEP